jgi:hypothetical protein
VSDIVPTLDHVVVNARDELDAAAAAYERLGFTLTPRGYHTLGSANHLAIFGTHYLELIGVLSPDSQRRDVLGFPIGLNGLVFGTEDSTALHAALIRAGVDATPPNEFSRPVELPGGARDAVFRTVHVTPATIWPGRIYFCHHFTRDLVWRDEWRHHANGAVGVLRTLVASDDPTRLGSLFGRMFGAGAVRSVEGGVSLVVGLSRVDVLTHATVAGQLGKAGKSDERPEYMAALTLRTRSLAQAATALEHIPVRHDPARLTVPAEAAFGCAIEFVE